MRTTLDVITQTDVKNFRESLLQEIWMRVYVCEKNYIMRLLKANFRSHKESRRRALLELRK